MEVRLMTSDMSLYIAVLAFFVNLVGTLVGLGWKLSRVELKRSLETLNVEIDTDVLEPRRSPELVR